MESISDIETVSIDGAGEPNRAMLEIEHSFLGGRCSLI